MFALIFIIVLVIAVFAFDIGKRWWQETEWRRRWRRRENLSDED